MARIDTLSNFLSDVASSIRGKKGTTDKISPKDFDTEIESIKTGASFEMNDTSYLFYENARVSNIADLEPMFNNINHLYYMFFNASNFDKPVDLVGKISDTLTKTNEFYRLFYKCSKIPTIKISTNSTNQTTLEDMFNGCTGVTSIDLTGLDTSNVTSIRFMFNDCKSLENVPNGFKNLTLSKINSTNMEYLFANCEELKEIDLSNMSFPNVTSLSSVFYNCKNAKIIKLPKFSEKKITNLNYLFSNCNMLQEIDLNGLDTSKVTNVSYLFGYGTANVDDSIEGTLEIDFSNLSFTSLVNSAYATSLLKNNKSVRKINLSFLSNLTTLYTSFNLEFMFQNASSLVEIDLTPINVNTTGLKSLRGLFSGCTRLKTIRGMEKLNATSLTLVHKMFYNCKSLESIDLSNLDVHLVTDSYGNNSTYGFQSLFEGCEKLKTLDISNFVFNTSLTKLHRMFYGCKSLTKLTLPDLSNANIYYLNYTFYQIGADNVNGCTIENLEKLPFSKINYYSYAFQQSGITDITLDDTNGTIDKEYDCQYMFEGCKNLKTANLKVFGSQGGDSRFYSMSYMFANCTNLVSVDLSNHYCNSYNYKNFMFYNCSSLKTVKFPHQSDKPLRKMDYFRGDDSMFEGCTSLEVLDLRYYIVGNIQMSYGKNTFKDCRKLRKLDLRGSDYGELNMGSSAWGTGAVNTHTFENCGVDNDSPTIVYVSSTGQQSGIINVGNCSNLGWSTKNVIVVENPEEEVDMS